MSMNEQMNHAEESILHTYNRFPVMFDHGEGCYLYDTEGNCSKCTGLSLSGI